MRRNFVTTHIGAPFPATAVEADVFALPTEIGEPLPTAIGEAMPIGNAAFDRAVAHGGGHMVTIKPSADTYMPVYYDAHGKSHAGKVHHVKHPHHHK